ncbi:kinase-like protein [Delitschia confertaspora ATCC 74209]|uniref:Kinase-like protein n=1 Tax=Delitschia confertaspora ATCC 74209 TaxID=1513339 RepID=A0A9P4MWZ0_9PLEO|nr:kinase-like protein [Delitschia confertaspora ATCC 74209]
MPLQFTLEKLDMSEDWQYAGPLADLFPLSEDGSSIRATPFSECDFERISAILELHGKPAWSKVARTYAVLRMSQALKHLDSIIQKGVTDISIPYSPQNLPSELLPMERIRFLKTQNLVLTDLLSLEKGAHLHISSRNESQFQTVAVLGKGGFARVEKVFSRLGQRFYAMKLLSRKTTFKKDQISLSNFLKELAASKRVEHHHVVKVIGSFTEPKFVGIIMDTIGNCDLEAFLDDESATLDLDKSSLLRTFFGCLCWGLIAIHEADIRHKDIKPKNILIKGPTVMYTDFGIALDYSQTDRSTTSGRPAMFTLQYCAPEVANWEDRRSSSDIFSLGAVFLEMATRLNSESIDNLRLFLRERNEYGSSAYCKNVPGIEEWAEHIRARRGQKLDKLPFDWVNACLKTNEKGRPTAHSLWEMIEEDTSHVSQPFACSTCMADHESSASEASTPTASLGPYYRTGQLQSMYAVGPPSALPRESLSVVT